MDTYIIDLIKSHDFNSDHPFYKFDRNYVSKAFKRIKLFDDSVDTDYLLELFDNKQLGTINDIKLMSHVIVCLETLENDLGHIQEYKNDIDKLNRYINTNNNTFPMSLFYNKESDSGHFYIITPGSRLELDFIDDQPVFVPEDRLIFKIGRSTSLFYRLSYYPPFTRLNFCIECTSKLHTFEQTVKKTLLEKSLFIKKKIKPNGGDEYFYGNYLLAIPIIMDLHKQFYPEVYSVVITEDDIEFGDKIKLK